MNEHEIRGWLGEVARDVPVRTDDDALASLHRAVDRDRRRRRTQGGLLVAAAAAVIGLAGWIAVPADDQLGVTSQGPPASTPAIPDDATTAQDPAGLRADVDLDRYTGIHPPLVTVTADGVVEVIDVMNFDGELQAHATVEADFPISWAAAGPRGASVFLVNADDATAVHFSLVERRVIASWPHTRSIAASPDHRTVARVEDPGGSTAVVVEHLASGRLATFDPPPGAPQPSGPLTWSPSGLLAVGHDDGSVAVLEPASDTSYGDAVLIEGPLHQPDWIDETTLAGTADCCAASPVHTVDVQGGERAEVPGLQARQVVSVPTGGSPWGWLVLDDDGTVRGTGGTETVLLRGVARMHL